MKEYLIQCECGGNFKIIANLLSEVYCSNCHKLLFSKDKVKTNMVAKQKNHNNSEFEDLQIQGYKIIKQIGEGGFARVFLALDKETKEKVAIKILSVEELSEEDLNLFMGYFKREVQVLSKLNHSCILQIKKSGCNNGIPYLIMEYLKGPTLTELIDNKKLNTAISLYIAYKICSALNYAFTHHNLIHRDIKPSNIIINVEGNKMPKLIDFGLAKSLDNVYHSLTATGDIVGTPYYMPREQLLGNKNIDFKVDIYSLGANVYHMLAGVPPYHEYSNSSTHVLLQSMLKYEPKPLELLRPDLPKSVTQVVSKAMAINPNKRFSSLLKMEQILKYCYKNNK